MRTPVSVSQPITVTLPAHGAFFAESIHDATFEMAWRRDPFHKLIFVLQGSAVREQGEPTRRTPLPAGALTLVPAGLEHRIRDERPSILLLLCLAPAFIRHEAGLTELWARLTPAPSPVFRLGNWWHHRLENTWRRALLEQVDQPIGHAAVLRTMAIQLLAQLARLPVEAGDGSIATRVESVVRELEGSFFDEWTLDRAATAAKISRRSFSSHFHRHTGRTFLEYLTELRLKHAAQLLAQGNHSIVGAAMAAGYHDMSHFYRLFRQRYGTTPKAWSHEDR